MKNIGLTVVWSIVIMCLVGLSRSKIFARKGASSSKEYYIGPEVKSYDDAVAACTARTAQLVKIDTEPTFRFLVEEIKSRNLSEPPYSFFIGLRTLNSSKYAFEWIDGTPLQNTFSYWAEDVSETNNHRGLEDCVIMGSITIFDSDFRWKDIGCRNRSRYICENEPISLTSERIMGISEWSTEASIMARKSSNATSEVLHATFLINTTAMLKHSAIGTIAPSRPVTQVPADGITSVITEGATPVRGTVAEEQSTTSSATMISNTTNRSVKTNTVSMIDETSATTTSHSSATIISNTTKRSVKTNTVSMIDETSATTTSIARSSSNTIPAKATTTNANISTSSSYVDGTEITTEASFTTTDALTTASILSSVASTMITIEPFTSTTPITTPLISTNAKFTTAAPLISNIASSADATSALTLTISTATDVNNVTTSTIYVAPYTSFLDYTTLKETTSATVTKNSSFFSTTDTFNASITTPIRPPSASTYAAATAMTTFSLPGTSTAIKTTASSASRPIKPIIITTGTNTDLFTMSTYTLLDTETTNTSNASHTAEPAEAPRTNAATTGTAIIRPTTSEFSTNLSFTTAIPIISSTRTSPIIPFLMTSALNTHVLSSAVKLHTTSTFNDQITVEVSEYPNTVLSSTWTENADDTTTALRIRETSDSKMKESDNISSTTPLVVTIDLAHDKNSDTGSAGNSGAIVAGVTVPIVVVFGLAIGGYYGMKKISKPADVPAERNRIFDEEMQIPGDQKIALSLKDPLVQNDGEGNLMTFDDFEMAEETVVRKASSGYLESSSSRNLI